MATGKRNLFTRTITRSFYILILIISFFPAFNWPGSSTAASLVVSPDLSPELLDDFCKDAWYKITSGVSYPIYLTLNTTNEEISSNTAVWIPDIPVTHNYLVEAYIPDHASIDWNCDTVHSVNIDTTQAHYTINHLDGEKTVIVNQENANGWTSLGTYRFSAGESGSVKLTDLNNETPDFGTTVLFSVIRLTQVENQIYLPLISKAPFAIPTFTWTSSTANVLEQAFSPGQTVRLNVKGTTATNVTLPVNFVWNITGPCSTYVIDSGTVNITGFNWSYFKDWSVPTCPGIYNYSVQVQLNGSAQKVNGLFVVNNPSTVAPFSKQFFDKCTVASTAEMQKWWTSSPYDGTNLYIGGISRACSNTLLNPVWVSQVAAQGWSFVPTWVGPQAPCTSYKNRFPSDINLAYQRGRTEAEYAAGAAHSLGFLGTHVIYYDMEVYSNTDISCRASVNSFFAGWTNRLHDLGYVAGAYGAASNADYWYTGLDELWVAKWYTQDKYYYDPFAGVYNLTPYLSNDEWFGHRLRQYTGGHNETWGGVLFNIDSNASHGFVNVIPQGIIAEQSTGYIVDFNILDTGEGFAIQDNRLLWTADSGKSWKEITPTTTSEKALLAGYFFDSSHGFVAAVDQKDESLSVLETLDGGASWSEVQLPPLNGFPGSLISLGFSDLQNGWLAVKLASSSNFSLGVLYRTTDGGKTWQQSELPTGGEVVFSTSETGWLAGGPDTSELYRTVNGGSTWEPIQLTTEDALIALPAFTSSTHASIAATVNDPEKPRLDIYSTEDGGVTWNLAASQPLAPETPASTPVQLAINGDGKPVVSLPGPDSASQDKLNGFAFIAGTGLPQGIVEMRFNGSTGWVYSVNGSCTGEKGQPDFNCSLQTGLFQTTDGGLSWEEITP